MKAHGTWQQTGGGTDFSGLIQAGVMVGATIGIAVIVIQLMWLIISIGVVAVGLRLWILYRQTAHDAEMHAAFRQEHAIRHQEAAEALAKQRRHEIEVARAGAQPVQIINVIDPAALLAAGFAPRPAPYRAEVVRAEVER